MQAGLKLGGQPPQPSPPRSSSPFENHKHRASLSSAADAVFFLAATRPSVTDSPQLRPRAVRSNTFDAAVGESYLPMARRMSFTAREQSPASPASRPLSSYAKPSDVCFACACMHTCICLYARLILP